MLLAALLLSVYMLLMSDFSAGLFALLGFILLVSNIIGRALFYVVVIPTTMPGAFFWKNAGFVEHARETGLADMPQLGVAYEKHHAFDVAALIDTIRTTSMKQKLTQFASSFTG